MWRAFGVIPALALIVSAGPAAAQSGPVPPGGYGRPGSTSPLIGPRDQTRPRATDPAAADAIGLFARLCVTTRGNRERAAGIIGDGDSAVEKLDPATLRGLENGQTGGVGWIITMPLGDRILIEFPPGGACVVRAPRVDQSEIETAFRNLLDQYAASGRFQVERKGEQTRVLDDEPRSGRRPAGRSDAGKLKFRIIAYSMSLPDSDDSAQLVLGSTDSRDVSIQASLSYALGPAQP